MSSLYITQGHLYISIAPFDIAPSFVFLTLVEGWLCLGVTMQNPGRPPHPSRPQEERYKYCQTHKRGKSTVEYEASYSLQDANGKLADVFVRDGSGGRERFNTRQLANEAAAVARENAVQVQIPYL